MTRTALLVLAASVCGLLLFTSSASAQSRKGDGYFEPGTFGFQLGIGGGTVSTTTVDENGEQKTENEFILGFLPGASYALHDRVALDLDTSFWLLLNDFELSQVSVTPGTRLFALPNLYGRLALQNDFKTPTNNMLLTGVGYFLGLGSVATFLEVNYIAWSRKEVDPPVIIRLGASVAF